MLISGDYSRDDLATRYSARELRTFLVSCKMTIAGCTEKADLIELAMKASHAPSRLHSVDQEHASHVARLKVATVYAPWDVVISVSCLSVSLSIHLFFKKR